MGTYCVSYKESTEYAKSGQLLGNVGARVARSNFYVGCVVYVGQNIFYVGQHFTWVITFYLGCVDLKMFRLALSQ